MLKTAVQMVVDMVYCVEITRRMDKGLGGIEPPATSIANGTP